MAIVWQVEWHDSIDEILVSIVMTLPATGTISNSGILNVPEYSTANTVTVYKLVYSTEDII
jgi:hypothetical protein